MTLPFGSAASIILPKAVIGTDAVKVGCEPSLTDAAPFMNVRFGGRATTVVALCFFVTEVQGHAV
ncbi:hypothetical protein [Yoonia rosea]|uniref:hypothetical protein n=1 Tax=Yoonia rosea TaxID=287098 RepID=UPI00097685D0|nr:hypothetical protein [Yoonia rosea]